MSIGTNIKEIKEKLPKGVKLIAVSKTKPIEMIQEAYDSGHLVFGENKALELRDKAEILPKDIEWHFIGHLQTNKVKYIIPHTHLIHSVDSLKLMLEIEKQSSKINKISNCLFQIDIANEETKFGFDFNELLSILSTQEFKRLKHIRFSGVMGIGSITDDSNKTKEEFSQLRDYFNQIKEEFYSDDDDFNEISMGMSDDYIIAINEGSTMIRVGSSIFGARNYNQNK